MHIGNKIRALADKRGIKIKDLYEYICVSKKTLYNIFETGKIKSEKLEKVAEFFQVPVSYFYSDEKFNNYLQNNETSVVEEEKTEFKTMLDNYKTTVEALQSENQTLKKLIEMRDEQVNLLQNEIEKLKG